MTARTSSLIWMVCICIVFLTGIFLFLVLHRPASPKTLSITGVVLADDNDPRKQVAISNVAVTVTVGNQKIQAASDTAGLFRFTLMLPAEPQVAFLTFQALGYRPLTVSKALDDRLLIVRLLPVRNALTPEDMQSMIAITSASVSIRYTTKTTTAVDVGALVKTFEATNVSNVPCAGNNICSPDARWKATVTSAVFEGGSGNRFLHARMSCIAGPCPFTSVEASNLSDPGSAIRVSVRNWSDTATFLVEGEVIRIVNGSAVSQSIPAIFGPALSFTLPPGAEGPSIEAEVNGTKIVFPFGPEHKLSWATCNVETAGSGSQIFRCDLKPGYRFR